MGQLNATGPASPASSASASKAAAEGSRAGRSAAAAGSGQQATGSRQRQQRPGAVARLASGIMSAKAKTVPQSTGDWTASDFPKAMKESVKVTQVCEVSGLCFGGE